MLKAPFDEVIKTAATALRTMADDLLKSEEPGQIAHIAGHLDNVGFKLMGIAYEAKNAGYKDTRHGF